MAEEFKFESTDIQTAVRCFGRTAIMPRCSNHHPVGTYCVIDGKLSGMVTVSCKSCNFFAIVHAAMWENRNDPNYWNQPQQSILKGRDQAHG